MPTYKVTRHGSSHYARGVRYHADPRVGRNYIELTEHQAKSPKFAHLGLVHVPHAEVDRAVRTMEAAEQATKDFQVATPDSDTHPVPPEPEDGHGDPHGALGRGHTDAAPPEGPEKVALPENWRTFNKAKKAGLVRRVSGENAVRWTVEQIDAFLGEYEGK